MKADNFFMLYSCCVITQGAKRDAIYDLQRSSFKYIPKAMTKVLSLCKKGKSVDFIKRKFKENERIIDEYFDFLIENEFGQFVDEFDNCFVPLDTTANLYQGINYAILDYSLESKYLLEDAIAQLGELRCEHLELRFYDFVTLDFIEHVLAAVQGTTISSVYMIVQYSEQLFVENIKKLHEKHPRMIMVICVGAPKGFNKILKNNHLVVFYTEQQVKDENNCGVFSKSYLTINTDFYVESLHYNNCLSNKLSVSRFGEIKNCPSMDRSFGNIATTTLKSAIENSDFRDLWQISKDKIEGCNICELRYICQDCRAYRRNKNDIFSKPLKCSYNPCE